MKIFFGWLFFVIYFGRDKEGQRKRGRETIPSRLHTVSTEPEVGHELTKLEIMT